MTTRTREIERKLVEFFNRQRAAVSNATDYPRIYVADPAIIKLWGCQPVTLSDLATAIELGEIA